MIARREKTNRPSALGAAPSNSVQRGSNRKVARSGSILNEAQAMRVATGCVSALALVLSAGKAEACSCASIGPMGWTSLSTTRRVELILAVVFPVLALLGYVASPVFRD